MNITQTGTVISGQLFHCRGSSLYQGTTPVFIFGIIQSMGKKIGQGHVYMKALQCVLSVCSSFRR
jgi:hypothetical protein